MQCLAEEQSRAERTGRRMSESKRGRWVIRLAGTFPSRKKKKREQREGKRRKRRRRGGGGGEEEKKKREEEEEKCRSLRVGGVRMGRVRRED